MALPSKPLTREEAIRMKLLGEYNGEIAPMSVKEAILAGNTGSVSAESFDKALINKERIELAVSQAVAVEDDNLEQ